MILDLFIYIIQFYINQNTFLPGFIIRKEYFNNLWNNNATNVEVFDFPESTLEKIHNYRRESMDLDVDEKEREARSIKKKVIIPKRPENVVMRDYQIEAYQNWKKNEFRGIYDMATGTGKLSQLAQVSKFQKKCSDSINKAFLNTQC